MRTGCLSTLLLLIGLINLLPQPIVTTLTQQEQQGMTCPQLVTLALDTAQTACTGLSNNEACYGHVLVDARPRANVASVQFNEVGDTVNVLDLQSMRLSAMSLLTNQWGVALLNVQTHERYDRPEDVTLLLFGDVQIDDAGEDVPTMAARVDTRKYVNVRFGPSLRAGIVDVLAPGTSVIANGRLDDTSWVRIVVQETGQVGWVTADLLSPDGDLATLDVVEPWAPYYGPMQAFYLQSGINDSLCQEAPESGLLIQTPEGVARVTLLVNEVSIQLDATAYVQAESDSGMTVQVLEGWADVQSYGTTQHVVGGMQVTIPMNSDMSASSIPGPLEPGTAIDPSSLPLAMLSRPIQVAPTASYSDIASYVAAFNASQTGTTTGGTGGTVVIVGPDGTLITAIPGLEPTPGVPPTAVPTNSQCNFDGVCGQGENVQRCPQDCYCGNGTCDPGENNGNCPVDCP